MKKHPLINAALAEGYIVVFALCVRYLPQFFKVAPGPVFFIVALLSAFVFSAAWMAYCFFAEPVVLTLDGNIKGAIKYFIYTLLYFAVLTVISLAVLLVIGI